ncbi:DUF488 domain-containing protein [Candidatus Woesearchaeota archaeon]|nr:DUF488 domain-containing protein [Candidatus Woesearchaeota archaeon]
MTLNTKCIKAPMSEEDGRRISVMSRHTLNDGTTPDYEISTDLFHEHWRDLAPPPGLVGRYYNHGLPWQELENHYLVYIRQIHLLKRLDALIGLAVSGNATILCIEATPEKCHRRLLAEECKRIHPSLEICIR